MIALQTFLKNLSALCFPPRCLCCDESLAAPADLLFCPDCLDKINFIKEPFCHCCGRAFPAAAGDNHLCGNCLTKPPFFTSARAIAHYQPPLADAIHAFKYSGRTYGLASFAQLVAQLTPPLAAPDTIIPVPLHPRKLRQRGFNQALLMARAFFPNDPAKIRTDLLTRPKWSEPQTALSGIERRRNLKGCFAVTNPAQIAGKSVLLVDDVYTTGSTANECARTLKKAGAGEVHVLTLARVAE
ncbi:MAG: ComF family protein [Desulfobulbaceae bacterium]|nr:ComF family protein [Desulfobulbaceae bacterium]